MPTITRSITRIQDADDSNLAPGPSSDGYAITWDNANGKFVMAPGGGATGGGAPPGGTGTELQYRNGSTFGAVAGSAWDGSRLTLPAGLTLDAPATIRPDADSTDAIKFQNAAATEDVATIDTTNNRLDVGTLRVLNGSEGIYMARGNGATQKVITFDGGNDLQFRAIGGGNIRFKSGAGVDLLVLTSTSAQFFGQARYPGGVIYAPTFTTSLTPTGTNRWGIIFGSSFDGSREGMVLHSRGSIDLQVNGSASGAPLGLGLRVDVDKLVIGDTVKNIRPESDAIDYTYQNAAGTTTIQTWDTTNGRVGIRQAAPTAYLDIAASTASNASMRIRSGTAPTTPNDGDLWYDGVNLKIRIGGTTYNVDVTAA